MGAAQAVACPIGQAIEKDSPVIILCDSYGTRDLQALLDRSKDSSFHSVIMLNPSVEQPINFNAVSQCFIIFIQNQV